MKTPDKNFIVRLRALIDKNMKDAGYNRRGDKFKEFISKFDNAEDYLFPKEKIKKQ